MFTPLTRLPSLLPRAATRVLLTAALATGATHAVEAAPFRVDFTGVVTNSRDAGGAFFGGAAQGGQNGAIVSGSFLFDTAAYADQNALPFFGVYGPAGQFPQPDDRIVATYTVASRTIAPSQWLGVPSGHSIEAASMQDIPPLNTVQQDIVGYVDGSQALFCSNPQQASTCTGGALATDRLEIRLFGITDFVGSDALAQTLDLDQAEIDAIVGGPGGGQSSNYIGYRYDANDITRLLYDFGGEFRLTSLRGALVTTPPNNVPEPEGFGIAALGLASLVLLRRRR